MTGVTADEAAIVRGILRRHAAGCEVRAFGSRIRAAHTPRSDLDLVVIGRERLGLRQMGALREAFEESALPYRVDALDWHAITPAFRAIIERGYEVVVPPAPAP